jgi:hypothetical protein
LRREGYKDSSSEKFNYANTNEKECDKESSTAIIQYASAVCVGISSVTKNYKCLVRLGGSFCHFLRIGFFLYNKASSLCLGR